MQISKGRKKVIDGKRSRGSTDIAFEHSWAKACYIYLLDYILLKQVDWVLKDHT